MKQKQGITTMIAAIAIIIALIIGGVGGYLLAPKPSAPITIGLTGEIPIGAPLPLSGNLATYGESAKVALQLAESEINDMLNASGASYTIKVLVEDTEQKPDVCLQKMQSLAAKGCKVMLGFYSSDELRACKNYADSNNILLISPSSTALDLAVPNDYIFRFCPADDKQAPAMAKGMRTAGIDYIVIMLRGDVYGEGLAAGTKQIFRVLGGSCNDTDDIKYNKDAVDFSTEVGLLSQKVQAAVDQYGADKVGVYAVTFEEVESIMTKALQYPVLSQVRWFGCDGSAESAKLTANVPVANFSITVKFPGTYFAPPSTGSIIEKVKAYVVQQLGREPDPYAYGVYDELWAVVKSMGVAGKYDGQAIKAVLPAVAETTYGASGWCQLNAAGDRTIDNYDFWAIYQVNATSYSWMKVGYYDGGTGTVTWITGWP